MTPPVRILIADDHTLLRAGVRTLLEGIPGFEVVGEATTGVEAVVRAEALRPDVVLMDVMMPGMTGLEATAKLTAAGSPARVIVLTMHDAQEYVLQAVRAGAAGYLLKDAGPDELERAVRAVARGENYVTPAVSRYLFSGVAKKDSLDDDPLGRLTPRQREVLLLIAEGLTTKQAAAKLGISPKTVEAHRAQLMESLGIHDIAGLVRFAIRHGLIRAD